MAAGLPYFQALVTVPSLTACCCHHRPVAPGPVPIDKPLQIDGRGETTTLVAAAA